MIKITSGRDTNIGGGINEKTESNNNPLKPILDTVSAVLKFFTTIFT
jgi:hypothetical protein